MALVWKTRCKQKQTADLSALEGNARPINPFFLLVSVQTCLLSVRKVMMGNCFFVNTSGAWLEKSGVFAHNPAIWGVESVFVTSILTVRVPLSLCDVSPPQALGGQPSPALHSNLCLHRGGGEAAASRADPQPRKAAGSHPGNLPCPCTLAFFHRCMETTETPQHVSSH